MIMWNDVRGLQENMLRKITFLLTFVLLFHYRFVSAASTSSSNVLIVSPLKKGMYPTPSHQSNRTSDFEEPFAVFDIPVQSTVNLTIDLRHLRNFTTTDSSIAFYYDQQWQILISVSESMSDLTSGSISALTQFTLDIPYIFTRNTTNKIDAHLFRLFAYTHLYLSLNILLLDSSLSSMRSEFFQCANIAIHQPQRAITGTDSMFAFVLKNNGAVNLPRNLPTLKSDYSYPDTLLTYSSMNSSETLQTLNLTTATKKVQLSNDQFWQTRQQLVIPYIPYISNCKSYGEFIYLHDVIENQDKCMLYNLTSTKPINPIGFGQTAISDTCDQVVFECLLDEAYSDIANYPKFYTLAKLSQVFFITGDPIVLDDSMLQMTSSMSNLIPVVIQNEFSTTYLPKNIDLVINYYQNDKKTKQIITAAMTFNNLILISNLNQSQPFQYNFTFSLHSMSQAELAIAFALKWPVYLLLSVIIGSFSVVFISLYYAIFKFANWISRRKVVFRDESPPFKWTLKSFIAKIKAGSHYFLVYEPIVTGIFLGFVPSFILHVIASMAMLGQFWSYPLQTCTTLTTDELCERSLIEAVMSVNINQSVRRGRLGFSLIIIGTYVCLRIIGIFIPNDEETLIREELEKVQNTSRGKRSIFLRAMRTVWEQEPILVTESFDGNTWFYNTWKRGLFCFMTILILVFMLVILNLSFSTYFGANQWTFTVILKLTQIFIEESFKIFMENEILLGSLSCVIAMTLSVSGLGATDFFAYLTTYFVNLGISTFEKVNQVLVVDFISDNAFEGAEKLNKWIQKQMEPEFEEKPEDSEGNHLANTQQIEPTTKDALQQVELAESANSDIILSEKYEESFDSYLGNVVIDTTPSPAIDGTECTKTVATSPTKRNPTSGKLPSKKTQAKPKETIPKISSSSECETEEDDDAFELRFKRALNLRLAKTQETNVSSYKSKQYTLREAQMQLQHQQKQQEEIKAGVSATGDLHSGSEQEPDEMNRQLKIYCDFCNNTFNLFQTPFEVVQMWMFYDSSQSFVKWGITKAGLFFYFLFTVANIPFQIITDQIFLKTVQQFHRIRINEYVQLAKQRFHERKFNWKVEDPTDFLHNIDDDLQFIDIWCFSSQYFFCLSLFVAGAMLIINGCLTIQANSYNTFSDTYIVTITLFWFWMCAVIDFGCIWVYKHTRIWKIHDESKKEKEGTQSSQQQQQQPQQQQQQQPILSQDKLEPDIVDKHMNNNNESQNYLRTGEEWLKSNQKELQNQQQQSQLQQSQLPRSPVNQSEHNMKTQVVNAFQNALISRNQSKINVLSSQSLFDPQEGDHFMKSKKREDIPRLQDQPQYMMFQQMMNKQVPQIQLLNRFVTEHSPQLSPSQRQSTSMFLKSKKSRMSVQKQQASLHSWVYSHEATINQTIKSNIILEIQYLKQIISQSRLIREFIENLVEETKDSDLGVHSYLATELCPVESWNLTIEDRFGQLESQQLNKSAKNQLRNKKSWMSFKDNFKQAIELQAKTTKLKEQKLIMQATEFQDERFRRKFLKRNKKWFRDNIGILFEDIMIGEAFCQIKKYRPMILQEFSNIFGEIPSEIKIIQTEVKEEDAQKANQNRNVKVSVNSMNRVKFLIRYWNLRARILKFAENCIGGLMLRGGDKTTCDYCRNNWGLTAQLAASSIEDMFLCFVKKTIKRDFLELELFVSHHDSDSFQFRVESQRFIEAWQEYFLANARFVSICLECNNDAQSAFEERICQKRRRDKAIAEQEEQRKKQAYLKVKDRKHKNSNQEDLRSSFSSFHSQSQFLQLSQNNLMQSQQQSQLPFLQSPNQWETRMVESQEMQNSKEMDSPPFAPSIHLRKSSNNIPSLHELQLLDESLANIPEPLSSSSSHNRRSSLIFRKHHNSKQKLIQNKNQSADQSHSDGEDIKIMNGAAPAGGNNLNENDNSCNTSGNANPNSGGVTNLGRLIHSNLQSGSKQLVEKSSLVIVEDVNEDVSYGLSKMNSFVEDFKLGPQLFHRENSNRQRVGTLILRQSSYQQQKQNTSRSRNSSKQGSLVQQQQTHPEMSIAKSQLAEEEEDEYDRDDGTNNQKGYKKSQENRGGSQSKIEQQQVNVKIIASLDEDEDNKEQLRLQPPPNTNIRNIENYQGNILDMMIHDGRDLSGKEDDYGIEIESPYIQGDSPDFGMKLKNNNKGGQHERMSLVGLLSPQQQHHNLFGQQTHDIPQFDTYEHDVAADPQTLQTDENDKLHSTEFSQRQQINSGFNSK